MHSMHAPIFSLDLSSLEKAPGFTDLTTVDQNIVSFRSEDEFRRTCAQFCANWNPLNTPAERSEFQALKDRIPEGGNEIIKTSWGGVVITKHDHPHIETFLVVNASSFLAFEKHELKEESLSVREGAGILLHHRAGQAKVDVVPLIPGVSRFISPGEEHCIVALGDLLVFEESKDYKGMDKDLIFIFMGS